MGSNFVPVETILKIDDDESAEHNLNNDQVATNLQPSSPDVISTGIQCSPVDSEPSATSSNSLKDFPLTAYTESVVEKLDQQVNISPEEETNIQREYNFSKHWIDVEPTNTLESTIYQNAKFLLMTSVTSAATAVAQGYQSQSDEFFQQFDYKTRNIIKTKQRRSDPCYRDQERSRQRTVMRLKRQDPDFREAERERGRFRMRIKRLNPEFRNIERQRQRERMKLKRQDPSFREREREQQKNRIHERRLDPQFREKERAQDRLRAQIKRQNGEICNDDTDNKKLKTPTSNQCYKPSLNTGNMPMNSVISNEETNSTVTFDGATDVKPLLIKDKLPYETFQFRKGPVYNFHLYTNGKDQWLTSANSLPKGPPQFTIMKDDEHHESEVEPLLDQNDVLYNIKDGSDSSERDSNSTVELNAKSDILVVPTEVNKSQDSTSLFSENCKTNLNNLSMGQHSPGS